MYVYCMQPHGTRMRSVWLSMGLPSPLCSLLCCLQKVGWEVRGLLLTTLLATQGLNAALEGRTEGRAPEPESCGGGGRRRQTGGWWGEGEGVAVGPWGSGSRGLKLQEAAFLLGSPTIIPPTPCPTLATRQGSAKAWPGRAQPCMPASGPHPTPSLGILSSLCAAPAG